MINVLDYGAVPNNAADDSVAIQAALDAARDPAFKGGAVYFPRGDYRIEQQLVVPYNYDRPLVMMGDGFATRLVTPAGYLLPGEALLHTEGSSTMTLENMSLVREDAGRVVDHVTDRLRHAVFRNLCIISVGLETSEAAMHLEGLLETVFDNVLLSGAGKALYLKGCSHVGFNALHTWMDHQIVNGIDIEGGGSLTFTNTRINANEGGTSIRIHGQARGITFNGLNFEGKRSRELVRIEDAIGVDFSQLFLAAPFQNEYPSYGLHLCPGARNVRVAGGYFSSYLTGCVGSKAVCVESDVADVSIENVQKEVSLSEVFADVEVAQDVERFYLGHLGVYGLAEMGR